jgi:DNA ligase-1
VREIAHEAEKGLVFEVAFEGLQRSTRHKSGLAMRFPRISRLRWDKPPREADTLETLATMLARIETGRGEITAIAATNDPTRADEAEIVLSSASSGDSHG